MVFFKMVVLIDEFLKEGFFIENVYFICGYVVDDEILKWVNIIEVELVMIIVD